MSASFPDPDSGLPFVSNPFFLNDSSNAFLVLLASQLLTTLSACPPSRVAMQDHQSGTSSRSAYRFSIMGVRGCEGNSRDRDLVQVYAWTFRNLKLKTVIPGCLTQKSTLWSRGGLIEEDMAVRIEWVG
jgi:hypothetical protein